LIETFAARPAEAPVLEMLTGRELDVFRLVASGLTNAKKAWTRSRRWGFASRLVMCDLIVRPLAAMQCPCGRRKGKIKTCECPVARDSDLDAVRRPRWAFRGKDRVIESAAEEKTGEEKERIAGSLRQRSIALVSS
jgi:hypothetical protein